MCVCDCSCSKYVEILHFGTFLVLSTFSRSNALSHPNIIYQKILTHASSQRVFGVRPNLVMGDYTDLDMNVFSAFLFLVS